MSLSFRDWFPGGLLCTALLLGCAYAPVSSAQQNFLIPQFEVGVEHQTNREMFSEPSFEDPTEAYVASAEVLMGRRTQRSSTQFRPRLRYQHFPDREGIDPLEAFADLRTDYRTLRGLYALKGTFARQDTYNFEFADLLFDDLDPETPTPTGEGGIVFVGETRTRYSLTPSFERSLTQRTGFGMFLNYEAVDYESDIFEERSGFQYAYLEGYLQRTLSERSELEIGPYVTRYEAEDNTNETNSYGLSMEWSREWSQLTRFGLAAQAEQADVLTRFGPLEEEHTETSWGVAATGNRRTLRGAMQFSLGRHLSPSGRGSRSQLDELRATYSHNLSQRLSFRTAVRLASESSLSGERNVYDRRLARLELSMNWLANRTCYIAAGYRYAWQEREGLDGSDADDNTVFLRVGFRGLDPRRPSGQ